jgi:peptide/nickel transport system permease protein
MADPIEADSWLHRPPRGPWHATAQSTVLFARRLARNRAALVGLTCVAIFLVLAALSPLLVPADANQVDTSRRLLAPSAEHWFGTDDRGRDVFGRTLLGTRVTLYIVLLSFLITTPIGVLIGCTAGFAGGVVESVLIRLTDIFLAFPALILAMVFAGLFGRGLDNAILAIALSSWPVLARLAYVETLRIRGSDFIAAARMQGCSAWRIVLWHIAPICVPVVVVRATLSISNTILTAASLGFLGLGAQPPVPEWGVMLAEARQYMAGQWWMVAAPGIAIVGVSLAFNFLGDGLRDLLDPRSASR